MGCLIGIGCGLFRLCALYSAFLACHGTVPLTSWYRLTVRKPQIKWVYYESLKIQKGAHLTDTLSTKIDTSKMNISFEFVHSDPVLFTPVTAFGISACCWLLFWMRHDRKLKLGPNQSPFRGLHVQWKSRVHRKLRFTHTYVVAVSDIVVVCVFYRRVFRVKEKVRCSWIFKNYVRNHLRGFSGMGYKCASVYILSRLSSICFTGCTFARAR